MPFRSWIRRDAQSPSERLWHRAIVATVESPGRFRTAIRAGQIARALSPLLPATLRSMISLVPQRLPPREKLPTNTPARGERRARVALLAGCAQQVLRPSINRATVRVLAANGVEVVVPPGQRCCGALSLHGGLTDRAAASAAQNAAAFPADVDAIITTAAGCGSAMKEQSFRTPVRDVAEFLDELGIRTPMALSQPAVVAYHDACHLSHGQGVRAAPRRLLQAIDRLTLVEVGDADVCCGSAGLYNIEQPDTAAELGRRKAAAVRASGAEIVASGNIGCLTQLDTHLAGIPVRHTIEVIDSAI